jgi:hypothetical protein
MQNKGQHFSFALQDTRRENNMFSTSICTISLSKESIDSQMNGVDLMLS